MTAPSRRAGTVWIVGAGPGSPDLLTVRAARLIATADDLVVDALVPPEVYADSRARVIYVGKRAGRPRPLQRDIEKVLVRLAREGRRVVRLKGGDPSVYGRLGEELAALAAAGVAYEIVPGVSSLLAVPLTVGIPLTERDVADRIVVLTGHRRRGREELPALPDYDPQATLVLMMALGNLEALTAAALERGYPPQLPGVVVSRASLPDQRSVAAPLETLPRAVAEAGLAAPATVVLGQVAARLLSASDEERDTAISRAVAARAT